MMLPKKIAILKGFAALLSALLLWTAFPPAAQADSAWLALAPLLLVIRASTPRHAFAWCWLSGLIFWCCTLSWFPAIIKNGGPWALVFLGQFALSAWCALYFGVFGFVSARVWQWAAQRSWARILAATLMDPLLWVGTEYVRGHFVEGGFAWNFLGVSQVNNRALIQIASLFGVYGVSVLVMLVNGAIAGIIARSAEPFIARLQRRSFIAPSFGMRLLRSAETFLPFTLVFLAWGWGLSRQAHWMGLEYTCPVWRIALIQPNTPCVFIADPNARQQYRKTLFDQTRFAAEGKPDLTLWPESALTGTLPYDQNALAMVREGVAAAKSPLLTGTTELLRTPKSAAAPEGFFCYNAAWLFSANADPIGRYRKQHLVPFGEYIPLDKRIPLLQRLAPVGSCTPGTDASVIHLTRTNGNTLAIGTLICFEDTIPDLSRAAVKAGARLLALLTNDAWFNGSIEPVQHLHQAIFRAVENGVPMVRCANSGISCVVDPTGRTTRLESDGTVADFHGFIVTSVHVPETPLCAPYTRYGDLLLAIPGMFFVIGLLVIRKRT